MAAAAIRRLQVLLTGDPALVAGAANLLLTVLQHNAGEGASRTAAWGLSHAGR